MRRALLALLVLVPLAGAQASVEPATVGTTLYFHLLDVQDMPINTQEPDPAFADAMAFGLGANTLTCLDPATGPASGGFTSQDYHVSHGYSSNSFVEYGSPSGDGRPRTHPERGLAYDIPLDRSVQPVLHWFLAEASPSGPADAQRAPLPDVTVRAEVRASDSVSVDDKAYDTGLLLMDGATRPVTASGGQVLGDGATQVTASQAGGRWVYDFAVPLRIQTDLLPRVSGFTVRIDTQVAGVPCAGGKVMPATVEPFTDAAHRPRIELRHGEPLRAAEPVVASAAGQVTLRWNVTSAWGAYDVDAANASLRVYGPAAVEPVLAATVQRTVEHGHLLEPVEWTWTLDARGLPDGRYTAVLEAPNLQRTATASAERVFYVHEGRVIPESPQQAPAPPLAALAGLALAAVLRRRA